MDAPADGASPCVVQDHLQGKRWRGQPGSPMISGFSARMSHLGCFRCEFRARVSYEMVVFGGSLGRIGCTQNEIKIVWVTLPTYGWPPWQPVSGHIALTYHCVAQQAPVDSDGGPCVRCDDAAGLLLNNNRAPTNHVLSAKAVHREV